MQRTGLHRSMNQSTAEEMTIGFIGAGKMAQALASGFVASSKNTMIERPLKSYLIVTVSHVLLYFIRIRTVLV